VYFTTYRGLARHGMPSAVKLEAGAPPAFLTTKELAERWRRTRKTVERHYAEWGLTPARLGGGPLLFAFTQILEVEERAMRGELVPPR